MAQLGNSDLVISSVGLGTWAIGGDGVFGWGPQDDADSIAAIRRSPARLSARATPARWMALPAPWASG